MIRRNCRYTVIHNREKVVYPSSETSQMEPSLHDILVAYSRGDDVSEFIRMPASKATAEQQFMNKIGKVDFLTESEQYVKNAVKQANNAVKEDKAKLKVTKDPEPSINVETPSES